MWMWMWMFVISSSLLSHHLNAHFLSIRFISNRIVDSRCKCVRLYIQNLQIEIIQQHIASTISIGVCFLLFCFVWYLPFSFLCKHRAHIYVYQTVEGFMLAPFRLFCCCCGFFFVQLWNDFQMHVAATHI